jgi:hypothetical protein
LILVFGLLTLYLVFGLWSLVFAYHRTQLSDDSELRTEQERSD